MRLLPHISEASQITFPVCVSIQHTEQTSDCGIVCMQVFFKLMDLKTVEYTERDSISQCFVAEAQHYCRCCLVYASRKHNEFIRQEKMDEIRCYVNTSSKQEI